MKKFRPELWLLFLCFLTGCAFQNKSLSHFDAHAGYRLANLRPNPLDTNGLFVVLTFSGGGTRAAAFAYGAMQELAATPVGQGGAQRRLLDDVDIISSVSGGSFTAAYYALYRDAIFTNFDRAFLKKNVQLSLGLRVLNPFNWPRLSSPCFDRIDLAAECYDDLLFKHHTYQDLLEQGTRPYIILNATDMSLESQFEFTQDQFDLLSSDLGSYPIARAVAASSAFPGLLSPLTLKNYPAVSNYLEAAWITDAAKNEFGRDYRAARQARTYEDATRRAYIHLLDGGLSDNLGLRNLGLASSQPPALLNLISAGKIKKLVVIAVNAKPGFNPQWDQHRRAPGLLEVFEDVTSAPMDNYSLDTIDAMFDQVEFFQHDNSLIDQIKALAEKWHCPLPPLPATDIQLYPIELNFDLAKDQKTQQRLKSLPTNYNLSTCDVDLLEQTARQELRHNQTFQDLLKTLR